MPDDQWHLSKAVPISILAFLIFQSVSLIVWAVRLDARVERLEASQAVQDARLAKSDDFAAKMAVMDERQTNIISRLDIQTKTMQEILSIVAQIKKPAP